MNGEFYVHHPPLSTVHHCCSPDPTSGFISKCHFIIDRSSSLLTYIYLHLRSAMLELGSSDSVGETDVREGLQNRDMRPVRKRRTSYPYPRDV